MKPTTIALIIMIGFIIWIIIMGRRYSKKQKEDKKNEKRSR